jgi:hypothetical protein
MRARRMISSEATVMKTRKSHASTSSGRSRTPRRRGGSHQRLPPSARSRRADRCGGRRSPYGRAPAAGLSERTEQLDPKSVVVERVLVATLSRLRRPPVALDPRAEEALDRGADHSSSTAAKRNRQLVGQHGLACGSRSVDRNPHRMRARNGIDRVDDGGNGPASPRSSPHAHRSSLRSPLLSRPASMR